MDEMPDSIVVKRLVRNLQYRQTYIRAFGLFLEPEPHPEVVRLLHVLIGAQESAVVQLSRHLQDMGVEAESLPLVQKLLDHASSRKDVRSRMRFIHYGLTKAVSWYKQQLVDREMTADPDLKQLLFELGEKEAAGLWRTQMTMDRLGIRDKPAKKAPSGVSRTEPVHREHWRSSQMDHTRRPARSGERRLP